jgi:hypothetical protein
MSALSLKRLLPHQQQTVHAKPSRSVLLARNSVQSQVQPKTQFANIVLLDSFSQTPGAPNVSRSPSAMKATNLKAQHRLPVRIVSALR